MGLNQWTFCIKQNSNKHGWMSSKKLDFCVASFLNGNISETNEKLKEEEKPTAKLINQLK